MPLIVWTSRKIRPRVSASSGVCSSFTSAESSSARLSLVSVRKSASRSSKSAPLRRPVRDRTNSSIPGRSMVVADERIGPIRQAPCGGPSLAAVYEQKVKNRAKAEERQRVGPGRAGGRWGAYPPRRSIGGGDGPRASNRNDSRAPASCASNATNGISRRYPVVSARPAAPASAASVAVPPGRRAGAPPPPARRRSAPAARAAPQCRPHAGRRRSCRPGPPAWPPQARSAGARPCRRRAAPGRGDSRRRRRSASAAPAARSCRRIVAAGQVRVPPSGPAMPPRSSRIRAGG